MQRYIYSHISVPACLSEICRLRTAYCVLLSAVCCLLCLFSAAFANNLSVSNVTLMNRDTVHHTYDIRFNISWDNSWYDTGAPTKDANWDAAWVFVKYQYLNGSWSSWAHCKLWNTGNTADPLSQMSFGTSPTATTGTCEGIFIYRSASNTGHGSNTFTGETVKWDYGVDGVNDSYPVKVKVIGIEMVYIPLCSFKVGSGGTEPNAFYQYPTQANPFPITGEAQIPVSQVSGSLYYAASSGQPGDLLGPIPAAFPKGYNAFYLMKYKITQGQYADFLNMLTSTQAATRYYVHAPTRYTIAGSYPNISATRPYRCCPYLEWQDVTAYADWAALRPYTELEYEKACRGWVTPVANEFACGSISQITAATISGNEDGTETISAPANSNINHGSFSGGDGGTGPLRAGIFATSNNRVYSGSGYYGNMDLSAGIQEFCVTVGKPLGRSFLGTHGDGILDASGNATGNTDWPSLEGNGMRGGTYGTDASQCCVSSRMMAAYGLNYRGDFIDQGGRAARTAP